MSLYTWMCRALALLVFIVAVFQPALASNKSSDSKQNNGTTGALYLNPNGPLYSDDSYLFSGNCDFEGEFLFVAPGEDTTITMTMTNAGTEDNPFSIVINYFDSDDWITASAMSGVIPHQEPNTFMVDFIFTAPPGAVGGMKYYAEIIVFQSNPSIATQVIPVCLVIAFVDYFNFGYDLATSCKKLRIFRYGNLSSVFHNAALNYLDDCDTFNVVTDSISSYLYNASAVVCRIQDDDTLRFTMYGNQDLTADDNFRPLKEVIVDNSHESYNTVTAEYMTADYSIGMKAEYMAPKHPDTCEFIVQRLTFKNISSTLISPVLVGMIFDWDVPSDINTREESGYDLDYNLIYQVGIETNLDDSTEALCPQESDDRYAAIAFMPHSRFGAQTIDGRIWTWGINPYGVALAPGPTYEMMYNNLGFHVWSPSHPDTPYTDLSTMITFYPGNDPAWSPEPGDSVVETIILLTGRDGYDALIDELSKARAFLMAHEEWLPACCDLAGDANNDAYFNIGDAAYLIGYIFKDGPEPPCIEEGDANDDNLVNLGDVVHIINAIFKDGSLPVCGSYQW